mgnify:CR=1 FL=1
MSRRRGYPSPSVPWSPRGVLGTGCGQRVAWPAVTKVDLILRGVARLPLGVLA